MNQWVHFDLVDMVSLAPKYSHNHEISVVLGFHPPSQETPYLCGEECFRHLLRRDVALCAGRMTAP
jgi:hypothetical protein